MVVNEQIEMPTVFGYDSSYRLSVQVLKVEQTFLQTGLLHCQLEMGHLLHTQAHNDNVLVQQNSEKCILQYLCARWKPTWTASARPSSRRLSCSRLVIMLTVSSTSGLLLWRCCSSLPVSAASLWSVLVLHVSGDGIKSPSRLPSDCLCFNSEKDILMSIHQKCMKHYVTRIEWRTIKSLSLRDIVSISSIKIHYGILYNSFFYRAQTLYYHDIHSSISWL